jgi:hypothetical protein
VAIVVLALAWTGLALISSPPASAEETPGPVLLAGSDCDENGPFVQYRVTNATDDAETLTIAIDNQTVIGSARMESDDTKRGRIEWRGNAARSIVIEARWATNEDAPISTITVAPNPCITTSEPDLTGPAFMAGTDCRDEQAILRWWMSNTADEHRFTYVSIGSEDGSFGETIWPADGSSELLFAGAQTGGVLQIPLDYGGATTIRVSGWAEGSSGIAETWTQMVVPVCTPGGVILASDTSTVVEGGGDPAGTIDPLDSILSTSPPVGTTGAVGGGSTTTTLPQPTTTVVDGTSTTTAAPGSSTTSTSQPPGSTTTTTTTTTRPPGTTTTTTRAPVSTTTTTSTPPTTTTTTTTTTTRPPTNLAPPVFLAGADCNNNGAFIRYRVTNNNSSAQTLTIAFNGRTRVSSVNVNGGQTKWGTLSAGGDNDPKPVVAKWVGVDGSEAPTLLMRASICAPDLPQPARGPSFVAGQDCSAGTPIVRWWMRNSAPTVQPMNVTVTKENNGGELTIWPKGGGTVDVDPDVQTAGVYTLPGGYNSPGQEVRIRGWWRELDPSAHNRVGIVLEDC